MHSRLVDCRDPKFGRVNKSGKPIEAPGNSYTLNPTGQPHSAMITTENIALVIYSGETDDVKSVEIVDIGPAPYDLIGSGPIIG